ncbi:Nucleoporin NDC1 [Podila humilis]|nr:Nucleoporin NDC1 [Podila humilis]
MRYLSTVLHVRSHLVRIGRKSIKFAWRFTSSFWIVYNLFFSPILITLTMRFVPEEILYHMPQYGPRFYSIKLACRLIWNTTISTALLEAVHTLCDQFLSKAMQVTVDSVDPNACLISGLEVDSSSNSLETILTYHAFQELHQIAGYSRTRRAEIFSDVISMPSAWKQISTKCLVVLNKGKARIEGVNAAAPDAGVAAASENSTGLRRRLAPGQGGAVETDIFNTAKPVREPTSWWRPSKQDVLEMLDNFKGPSTEELLMYQKVEAEKRATGKAVDPTMRPVLTGPKKRPEVHALRWATKTVSDFISKNPQLQRHLEVGPSPAILHVMDDYQLLVWAFQSLARFVHASFQEDKFGIVQKEIPVILETMVGLLISLEKLVESGQFVKAVSSNEEVRVLVGIRSVAMVQALKSSIYQITQTFKNHLGDFILSDKTETRLKRFMELKD